VTKSYGVIALLTYEPRSVIGYVHERPKSQFVPLLELQTSDADLLIGALLKHHVMYSQPITDPFFAAHIPDVSIQDSANATYYLSDFPAAVFACQEQVRCDITLILCLA
jgi:hypothetical protein